MSSPTVTSLIIELRAQARMLHKQAQAGETRALRCLKLAPDASLEQRRAVQRRHCLAAIARQLGFNSWPHAKRVIEGLEQSDFGTLLYPESGFAYWNIWCASYDEAGDIRAQHGGYLLPYKHQYFICDRHFIECLGLDSEDADWDRIGRDWVRPTDTDARWRLCHKLVQARSRSEERL